MVQIQGSSEDSALIGLLIFLYPINFFYYFLYYTDTVSTLSVVIVYYLALSTNESEAQKAIFTSEKKNKNSEEILEYFEEPRPQTEFRKTNIGIRSKTANFTFSAFLNLFDGIGFKIFLFLVSIIPTIIINFIECILHIYS